jgi:branched-chain amino acid aminotransferase
MTEQPRTIWRDGEFVAWQDATVHVLAQSLQRGSLAFDYMSVHETAKGTAIFRLDAHIDRLLRTCEITGLPLTYSKAALMDACAETVRKNPGAKSVKISALLASIEVELVPQDPTVSVFIAAYDSAKDIIETHENPLHFSEELTLKVERDKSNRREDIIPPHAKVAANYTSPMMAKWKARNEGFDDIILLDEEERVAEAPTSNLFMVDASGELVTPPAEVVLLGITRASIIDVARALGMSVHERDITVSELLAATEVFLTATSIGVWPVIKIDNQVIGNGKAGVTTTRLAGKLKDIQHGLDADFDHWLDYVEDE